MVDLRQGDCIQNIINLKEKSIDTIITDPPYTISKKCGFSNSKNKGSAWKKFKSYTTDFGDWDKEQIDLSTIAREFYRILRDGGTAIIFYDIWKMQELKQQLELNGFRQFRLIRWDKTNPVPVNSKVNYLSNSSEYAISAVKGSNPIFNSEYDNGVYSFPICSGKERTKHPTQKPLSLMEKLVEKHSNEGCIILDPFMGSGTTGVACVNTNRNFIGMELDEKYFNIAKERINKKLDTRSNIENKIIENHNSAKGLEKFEFIV